MLIMIDPSQDGVTSENIYQDQLQVEYTMRTKTIILANCIMPPVNILITFMEGSGTIGLVEEDDNLNAVLDTNIDHKSRK